MTLVTELSRDPSARPTESIRGQRKVSLGTKLDQVRQLSKLMDDQFRVPGTPIRFGFDSIVGLVPGIGDAVTVAIPLWILYHAHAAGTRKRTLARMAGNIAVDAVVGVIPVVGDLFDVYWKANQRNLRLLEKELPQLNPLLNSTNKPTER